MKLQRTLLNLVFVLIETGLLGQSPPFLNYQAVIRDNTGAVITDQEVNLKISICIGNPDGDAVYSETHTKATNGFGLVSLRIGDGTENYGRLDTIQWGGNHYFLRTEIDPTGSSGYTEIGTMQLLSVPYALYAEHAGNAESSSFSDLTGKPVTLDGYGITDAVKKQYVDSMLIRIGDIQKLLGSGFTPGQLLNGGRTLRELLSDSVPVADLYNAGVSVQDMYAEGVLSGRMEQAGIPFDVLVDAGLAGILNDVEGNTYRWIMIGEQAWMAENLKVTKYNDGTAIYYPDGDNSSWTGSTAGSYAWYNRDENTYKEEYGAMYNWYATASGKLCPQGWHVPSYTEWDVLIDFLGADKAIEKLVEAGNAHWTIKLGTNESGFNALPGGFRSSTSGFNYLGRSAEFWTSTAYDETHAYCIWIFENSTPSQGFDNSSFGFSIRCIKDE